MALPRSSSVREPDVLVVGAGHNGLTAAVYLALRGLKVEVVEATDRIGGLAANYEPWPGFKAPLGAYVLGLYPRWLLERLGVWDKLRLLRRPVGMTVLLGGGKAVTVYSDSKRTARIFRGFSEADARAYLEWDRLWSIATSILRGLYENEPLPVNEIVETLYRLQGVPLLGDRVKRVLEDAAWALTASAGRLLEEWFESWEARTALAEDALVGELVDAYHPGTGLVLAHHYLGAATGRAGEWVNVAGGMGALSEALAARLRGLDGVVRLGCPVTMLTRSGRGLEVHAACGVYRPRLGVIFTGSVKQLPTTAADLLEKRVRRGIESLDSRGASAKLVIASRKPPLPRAGVDVVEALQSSMVVLRGLEHASRALGEALHRGVSSEPWLSVNVVSAADPSLAPEGWSLTSVFLQYAAGGAVGSGAEWRERVLDAARSVMDDEFSLDWDDARVDVLTPGRYESEMLVPGGHIFHIAMKPDQIYGFRPLPGSQGPRLPGCGEPLYLGGASAHPGGGVSGLPGLLAAERLLADRGLAKPRRVNLRSLALAALRGSGLI